VRTRRVSSRQLAERSLERISRLGGQLNAVVALRAELALGAARRSTSGLPFGLQVTGPRFRGQLLLDLASAWERAHPWPGPPMATSRSTPASPDNNPAYVLDTK